MRPIKFRIWDERNQNYISVNEYREFILNCDIHPDNFFILQQYIGIHDKNGNNGNSNKSGNGGHSSIGDKENSPMIHIEIDAKDEDGRVGTVRVPKMVHLYDIDKYRKK